MTPTIIIADLLVQYRTRAGMTQVEAARRSGIGVKTLSSFETNDRTHAMKLAQFWRLLATYGVSLTAFDGDYWLARHELRRSA
jgi:transcriptional regulator with XRE-family HTH domain